MVLPEVARLLRLVVKVLSPHLAELGCVSQTVRPDLKGSGLCFQLVP